MCWLDGPVSDKLEGGGVVVAPLAGVLDAQVYGGAGR